MSNKPRIWFNGELRDYEDCTVHVASHALHYGSSVFEGIRAYETPNGTMIMRGMDHLKRLEYSAGIYRIPLKYSLEELHAAMRETIRDSGLASAYIRPIIARGNCGLGVVPKDMDLVETAIMVAPWGAYLGEEGVKNGIAACITSWNRLAPNTMPTGAKAGGNYVLTTGTGSGKSLAYIVPIVDHVLRRGSGKGIQAIVVYPMNALANSQMGELEIPGWVYHMEPRGDRVYALGYDDAAEGRGMTVSIFDVSDMTTPTMLDRVPA